ncbi:alpha-glucoside transport, partial [Fusarium albosuccineum]
MAEEKDKVAPTPAEPALDADPSKAHATVVDHARSAAHKEQNMTLMQGIKLYPKAIAWSLFISTFIVMEGYDISLVNNFYAFPQFNRKYGKLTSNGDYQVSAAWQSGLSNV